ncbi:hypothetical protein MWN34_18675 [Ancylobacter sp. 6x-1]|uniref:Uncharacterized protein n=1 Tax=Ancylobacter crimeensis TaxID=2579147 RepID=A0ABT0DG32_9HYPH|nr:hypothetical protein [Ancylobacter crimeensis]MCK0198927.1 hypothetical protein [Ancylobacter crimeensis]
MRKIILQAIVALLPLTAGPHAEEVHKVERGTEGLSVIRFHLVNETDRPLACAAAIAHWYSAELGTAAPHGELSAQLWSRPKTGEVFLLNRNQDNMPVQTLWCGFAGADVSTRSDILLARRAGAVEPAIELRCTATEGGATLECRRAVAD